MIIAEGKLKKGPLRPRQPTKKENDADAGGVSPLAQPDIMESESLALCGVSVRLGHGDSRAGRLRQRYQNNPPMTVVHQRPNLGALVT
jgi:hypothetical protein